MLTRWDYAVIIFYFLFMTSIGWVMKRFIRNTRWLLGYTYRWLFSYALRRFL